MEAFSFLSMRIVTLILVYLLLSSHFNFNPKDLQNVTDQLPTRFS